jgi:ribonuclease-3
VKSIQFKKIIEYIEKYLKYEFKNKDLVEHALTHKSFCIGENKNRIHNERLEFLGDAVLGLVVAENLMKQSPKDTEGALSKKRASLVNQEILAEKARKINLQSFLILGPGEKEQESHLKPRLLASAYEAIVGAFYQDADFEKVKNYLLSEFSSDIEQIKPDLEYEKDYKTRLQELTQKMKLGMPSYELVSTTGPSHKPEFEVSVTVQGLGIFKSMGQSKKIAEQLAAKVLIEELSSTKNNTLKIKSKK